MPFTAETYQRQFDRTKSPYFNQPEIDADAYTALLDSVRLKGDDAKKIKKAAFSSGPTAQQWREMWPNCTPQFPDLTHAMLGLINEVGEIAELHQAAFFHPYDSPSGVINSEKALEELGDLTWFLTLMCRAHGFTLEQVMEANLRKLKKRFPDKFTSSMMDDENRDKAAEYAAMKENESGKATRASEDDGD